MVTQTSRGNFHVKVCIALSGQEFTLSLLALTSVRDLKLELRRRLEICNPLWQLSLLAKAKALSDDTLVSDCGERDLLLVVCSDTPARFDAFYGESVCLHNDVATLYDFVGLPCETKRDIVETLVADMRVRSTSGGQ